MSKVVKGQQVTTNIGSADRHPHAVSLIPVQPCLVLSWQHHTAFYGRHRQLLERAALPGELIHDQFRPEIKDGE